VENYRQVQARLTDLNWDGEDYGETVVKSSADFAADSIKSLTSDYTKYYNVIKNTVRNSVSVNYDPELEPIAVLSTN
tara:strand:+ start:5285 stop:5515 length:231 start_codon:yes stop_codon:yes gene_type:complete